MPHSRKHTARCVAPNCTLVGDFGRGFCSHHYAEFKKACVANGSWGRDPRIIEPERVKWEYLGDEQVLIQMNEQQERNEENENAKQ